MTSNSINIRAALTALALASFFLLFPFGETLFAQTKRSIYSVHDLNRDGYLSKSEYRLFAQYVVRWNRPRWRRRGKGRQPLPFKLIDKNGDGLITETEMTSALGTQMRKRRRHRYRGGRNRAE